MSRSWHTHPDLIRILGTCGGVLLLLGAAALVPVSIPTGESFQTPRKEPMEAIGPIADGTTVTQHFPSSGKEIAGIALELATYRRVNRGRFQVTVAKREGKAWPRLAVRSEDKASLSDNAYFHLAFDPPLQVEPKQLVSISITADGDSSNAIAWWFNPNWAPPSYAGFINGVRRPGTARLTVIYEPKRGHVGTMVPQLWKRVGVFLNPFWRIVLAAAGLLALFGFVHLILWWNTPSLVRTKPRD